MHRQRSPALQETRPSLELGDPRKEGALLRSIIGALGACTQAQLQPITGSWLAPTSGVGSGVSILGWALGPVLWGCGAFSRCLRPGRSMFPAPSTRPHRGRACQEGGRGHHPLAVHVDPGEGWGLQPHPWACPGASASEESLRQGILEPGRLLAQGLRARGSEGPPWRGWAASGPPADGLAGDGGPPASCQWGPRSFPASVTSVEGIVPPPPLSEPSARERLTPTVQKAATPAPAQLCEAVFVPRSHKMQLKPKTTQPPVEAGPPALGFEPLPFHPASCFPNSALRP